MRIWTSSVLLATLAVSGLSFPHPDDHEYKIPSVGTGQRSQYYVLHKDGTFKYGFDTGDGAFESVKSHTLGSLDGKFGYVDPDGNTIKLEYEAGRGGFVARGDHLPKPSPELAQALAAVVKRTEPFIDPLAGVDSDASYGFRFQSDDHSRTEEADADGTVTGSYSYTDENGVLRKFTYKAGKGIGFVIEGDGLTVPIDTPVRSNNIRPPVKSNVPIRSVTPDFRQSTSYTGNHAAIVSTRSQVPGDASYSFSYDADDHSRREVSDDNLNIEGSFSFVADDGQRRTLNYEAGSGTGFVAQGNHLPVAPAFNFGNRLSHGTRSSQAQSVSIKSPQQENQKKHVGRTSSPATHGQRSPQTSQKTTTKHTGSETYKRPQTTGAGATGIHGQRSQATLSTSSQKTGQQTSTRVSQSSLPTSKTGSGVSTAQGQRSSIAYKTGQKVTSQGQRSTGGSTTAPQVLTKQSGSQQQRVGSTQSQRTASQGSAAQSSFTRSSSTVGSKSPSFVAPPISRPFEEANIRSSFSPDGSYSYSYDTSSHSRSESGDADNNVVGKFDFIADDDGEKREITYEAGSATGFIAEGKHIPIGPVVPGAPSGQPTGRIIPVVQSRFIDPLADSDTDASYNFKFDSDTYSRSETADEDGNVVGTYTVVDDDGLSITYRFRAGKGIGFEQEEISRTQGPKPVKPVPYSGPLASDFPATFTSADQSSFTHSFSTGSISKPDTSFGIKRVAPPSTASIASTAQSSQTTKLSGSVSTGSAAVRTSYQPSLVSGTSVATGGAVSGGSSRTAQRTASSNLSGASTQTTRQDSNSDSASYKPSGNGATSKFSGSTASSSSSSSSRQAGTKTNFQFPIVDLKSVFQPSHTQQVFPGFKLFSYAPSSTAEKFGYVLKFDN